MRKLALFILFIGLSILPIYLFDSGKPQPSHFVLILSIILLLYQNNFKIKIEFFLMALWSFVIAREGIEFLLNGNIKSLMAPIFLSFNVFLFLGLSSFYINEKNLNTLEKTNKVIANAIIFSIVISLAGILILDTNESNLLAQRKVGTFNNPNQLGYYSVCVASIILLLTKNGVLSIKFSLILITLTFMLAIFSQSKAAVITIFILMAGLGWVYSKTISRKIVFGSILMGILLYGAYFLLNGSELSNIQIVNRISNVFNEQDSNLENRGYGLVKKIDGFNFFYGAGSQVEDESWTNEIHSTFFSIFVYYGVIGISLFLLFYLNLFHKLYLRYGLIDALIIYSPPFLYGITHNGFRFTIFWIYLVLCYVMQGSVKAPAKASKLVAHRA